MRDETILCISPHGWHSLWRNTHQVMSRLAQQNRVVFIEPGRFTYRSALLEFVHHLPDYIRLRPEIVTDNLIVIPTPSSLPHARRWLPQRVLRFSMPIANDYNARLLIMQARRALRAFEITAPILWLYTPYQRNLIGKFGEKLVCYHVYDEYAAFTQNARVKDLIGQLDNDIVRRADVIFASSRSQYERRRSLNRHTHFIPNAVDFDLFQRACEDGPLPQDIRDLPAPVIGFVGWMGFQIDIALLLKLAAAYPDASLALIGPDCLPDTVESRRLHRVPNVHFLGEKPRHHLPNYLRAFDVALVPFLLEGYVLSAYPLKLHEYLAAGLPVVTTALPELAPFDHMTYIADSHEAFVTLLGAALQDRSPQAVAARVAVAAENTWAKRIAAIYTIMEARLASKEAGDSP